MKYYRILLVLTVIVLVIAGDYVISQYVSYSRYHKEFEAKYDSLGIYRIPEYHELLKQKGKLTSLGTMAQDDSVGLYLNLPEREAGLMIKGLMVRSIPIQEVAMSRLFRTASDEALYQWLSEPLQIVAAMATIPKEPINVVIAPSDTADEPSAIVPDTSSVDPVCFIWETDRDLRLFFYQTEENAGVSAFIRQERWQEIKEAVRQMLVFRVPDYNPVIRIGLNREAAKALYRAIPRNGKIVITL